MDKSKNVVIGIIVIAAVVGGLIWFSKKTPSAGPGSQGASVNGASRISFKDAVGQKAPNFTLEDISGNQVELESLKGKNIVLFFNEGLMCYPACLDQVAELGKDSRFNSENVSAFSIVVDSPDSWKKAQKELPYLKEAKVLFDDEGEVSRLYDILKLPSVMHYGQYPGHTYFIIDKDGVIRFTLDDPSMGMRNDQIFAELQKLQ